MAESSAQAASPPAMHVVETQDRVRIIGTVAIACWSSFMFPVPQPATPIDRQ